MGGFFGVASQQDCIADLFYGTDYHCHLGTRRGGLAVLGEEGVSRFIHDISNAQFKSKFQSDLEKMKGNLGIGVISDYEDQPLIIGSHLGTYSIVTVGVIKNAEELARKAFQSRTTHFSEMSDKGINPTELTATLINREDSFEEGIRQAQESIVGSCSLLLLTDQGLYAARDRLGRTPVIMGRGPKGYAVTMETSAFPNLGYETVKELGPGEVVFVTPEGIEERVPSGSQLQICSFLWVYYGYPASSYEGINVERVRYASGAALARDDDVQIDFIAGIPDSGTAHALGYSHATGVPFKRPFVKYTPTWPRSFLPPNQDVRDLVARMKLIPIRDLTYGSRILFCDDSIVRGTQLRDTFQRLYAYGAKEIHLRIACPPLLHSCPFLNFSRSRSELDLAARKAISEMVGSEEAGLQEYARPDSEQHRIMVERICRKLSLTTLKYQRLEDMVESIGLPRERLCTGCWTGPRFL
jgi:amidophosphoribosyltransferase